MTNRTREMLDFAQLEPESIDDLAAMAGGCDASEIIELSRVADNLQSVVRAERIRRKLSSVPESGSGCADSPPSPGTFILETDTSEFNAAILALKRLYHQVPELETDFWAKFTRLEDVAFMEHRPAVQSPDIILVLRPSDALLAFMETAEKEAGVVSEESSNAAG